MISKILGRRSSAHELVNETRQMTARHRNLAKQNRVRRSAFKRDSEHGRACKSDRAILSESGLTELHGDGIRTDRQVDMGQTRSIPMAERKLVLNYVHVSLNLQRLQRSNFANSRWSMQPTRVRKRNVKTVKAGFALLPSSTISAIRSPLRVYTGVDEMKLRPLKPVPSVGYVRCQNELWRFTRQYLTNEFISFPFSSSLPKKLEAVA